MLIFSFFLPFRFSYSITIHSTVCFFSRKNSNPWGISFSVSYLNLLMLSKYIKENRWSGSMRARITPTLRPGVKGGDECLAAGSEARTGGPGPITFPSLKKQHLGCSFSICHYFLGVSVGTVALLVQTETRIKTHSTSFCIFHF